MPGNRELIYRITISTGDAISTKVIEDLATEMEQP